MEKEYVNLQEFAEIVGVKVRTVRDWIEKGAIQTFQVVPKGKHFILREDIPSFLRKSEKLAEEADRILNKKEEI